MYDNSVAIRFVKHKKLTNTENIQKIQKNTTKRGPKKINVAATN